jgi:Coenzyme PQQ synthesis protein D (PqqD)
MPGTLQINLRQIVHETIDGETILIHLGTGTYYSLDGVAAEVWAHLASGLSDEETIASMQASYAVEPTLVQSTVGAFVAELVAEGLLIEGGTGAEGTAEADATEPEGRQGSRAAFVPPVLHKYTDMQEFMLVDPIHDVDAEAGWPHVKAV